MKWGPGFDRLGRDMQQALVRAEALAVINQMECAEGTPAGRQPWTGTRLDHSPYRSSRTAPTTTRQEVTMKIETITARGKTGTVLHDGKMNLLEKRLDGVKFYAGRLEIRMTRQEVETLMRVLGSMTKV